MTKQLPHFHIMDSGYGDPLDRPIKTWNEAVRQLRKEKNNGGYAEGWHVEGSATEGAYYCFREQSGGDSCDADVILSIYTCTGEQPCPCEEGVDEKILGIEEVAPFTKGQLDYLLSW